MYRIFNYGAYSFWRDEYGYWNVTTGKQTEPPTYGAYATPNAIAKLKGLPPIPAVSWADPTR